MAVSEIQLTEMIIFYINLNNTVPTQKMISGGNSTVPQPQFYRGILGNVHLGVRYEV